MKDGEVTIGSLLEGGFRLIRERPGAMLIWTLIQLVAVIATSYAMGAIVQASLDAQLAGATLESAALGQTMWTGLLSLAQIAVGVVIAAAAQRAIIYPAEGGIGWLKLGMDEIRQFLLVLLYLLIFILSLVVAAVFVAPFLAGSGPSGVRVVSILLLVLGIVAFGFFGTRLSLTFSMTLKRRAFVMREGWLLTRGRFWTLFATYLVIFLIMLLFSVVTMVATEQDYLSAVAGYGFTSSEAEAVTMQRYQLLMAGTVNVEIIVNWVLSAIGGAIVAVLSSGAAATAVQKLTGDEAGLAETFS